MSFDFQFYFSVVLFFLYVFGKGRGLIQFDYSLAEVCLFILDEFTSTYTAILNPNARRVYKTRNFCFLNILTKKMSLPSIEQGSLTRSGRSKQTKTHFMEGRCGVYPASRLRFPIMKKQLSIRGRIRRKRPVSAWICSQRRYLGANDALSINVS